MDECTAEEHEAEAEGVSDGAGRDAIGRNGLRSLIWSFVSSGVLAVRTICLPKLTLLITSFSSSLTFSL